MRIKRPERDTQLLSQARHEERDRGEKDQVDALELGILGRNHNECA